MSLQKDSIIYLLSRILGALFQLSIIPLLLKKLPMNEFGIVGLLWAFLPIISKIISLSVEFMIYIKFYKFDNKERSIYIGASYLIIFFNGILLLLLLLLIDNNIFMKFFNTPKNILLLFFIAIWGQALYQFFVLLTNIEKRPIINSIIFLFTPLLIAVFSYIYILFIDNNYIGYIISLSLINFLVGIIGFLYCVIKYKIINYIKDINLKIFYNILVISLPSTGIIVFNSLLSGNSRFFLNIFHSLSVVAIFSYSYKMAESISGIIGEGLMNAFVPNSLKSASDNLIEYSERLSEQTIKFLLIFCISIAGVLVLPMKDVMLIISKEGYNFSYNIFMLLILSFTFFYMDQIISPITYYFEKIKTNLLLSLVITGINITLNIIFIPEYGLVGAGIIAIFSYFLMITIRLIYLNFVLNIKIKISKIYLLVFIFICYVIVIYLIQLKLNLILISFIFSILLFILLFIIYIVLIKEMRDLIKDIYFFIKNILSNLLFQK